MRQPSYDRIFKEHVGRLRARGVPKSEAEKRVAEYDDRMFGTLRRKVTKRRPWRPISEAAEARENVLDERAVKSILAKGRPK